MRVGITKQGQGFGRAADATGKAIDQDFLMNDDLPELTEDQKLELAACYAEYCGVDPNDRSEWRTEMVGAKRFVRELMKIWKDRSKRNH